MLTWIMKWTRLSTVGSLCVFQGGCCSLTQQCCNRLHEFVTFSRAVLVKKAQLHEGRSSADVSNGLIRTLSQQAREEERELGHPFTGWGDLCSPSLIRDHLLLIGLYGKKRRIQILGFTLQHFQLNSTRLTCITEHISEWKWAKLDEQVLCIVHSKTRNMKPRK